MTAEIPPSEGRVTLKSARKALGLTQTELAKKAGSSKPVICRIENGGHGSAVSYDTAYALADALGRKINEIYWPTGLTPHITNRKGRRSPNAEKPETRHATCPTCFLVLPATKRCNECAA